MGVELQMGGADQWGNITAGLELIRRTSGGSRGESDRRPVAEVAANGGGGRAAHGLAYKLLLSPSGTKFGKSETGESVWLDPARTSPYAFYQYWLHTDDRDVGTYLRWFTELPREEIEALEAEVVARPEARAGAACAGPRHHGPDAWAGRRGTGDRRFRGAVFDRARSTDPETLRSLYESSGGFTFEPGWLAAGTAVLLAEAGLFGVARRGAPADRERRRDGQRPTRHGSGIRPGARRRGVARRPYRQAPPRDRAPGALTPRARAAAALRCRVSGGGPAGPR